MKKIRKARLYAKYRVDLWGWLMYQRTNGSLKELLKILYVRHQIKGHLRRKYGERYELWKYKKRRKGFGRRRSPYKAYLQEKQKTQYFYGFAKEKQLRRIYSLAKEEKGALEEKFAGFLESRLLTVAYRMGFFDSMRVGVQYMIHHGLVVNGCRIKKPNYVLSVGDCLYLTKKDLKRLQKLRKATTGHLTHKKFPFWSKFFKKDSYIAGFFKKRRSLAKRYRLKKREAETFLKKQNQGLLFYPPGYLEISFLLRKVMLIYRPKPKEVFYPYALDVGRVVAYFKWW